MPIKHNASTMHVPVVENSRLIGLLHPTGLPG